MNASEAEFASNSAKLQNNIHLRRLHRTTAATYKVADLSNEELKRLYDKQLSRQGSRARQVYDHVKSNALHELCSYCQYGTANTLDHFIPITVVYALAIDPWNLVPACDRCNKLLSNQFIKNEEHQMLHPYAIPASLPPRTRWLHATVLAGAAPVVAFHADPDQALAQTVRKQIINQFDLLKLGDLYRIVSGRELAGACRSLSERFPGSQPVSVAAHLQELSDEAFAGDPNDRRGAMYEALAADSWFTSVGYELAP